MPGRLRFHNMGLWDRKKRTFGSENEQRRRTMSLRISWTLRTGLTLGAAALAFGLGSGPSIAAGHEGHGGSMAGMRGGGGGGAGEVRSLNERFGSMRIETLSSAGLAHPPAGLAHPTFRP